MLHYKYSFSPPDGGSSPNTAPTVWAKHASPEQLQAITTGIVGTDEYNESVELVNLVSYFPVERRRQQLRSINKIPWATCAVCCCLVITWSVHLPLSQLWHLPFCLARHRRTSKE
jgi:hypothetical protein